MIEFLLFFLILIEGIIFILYFSNLLLPIKDFSKVIWSSMVIATVCLAVIWYLSFGFECGFLYLICTFIIIFCFFKARFTSRIFAFLVIFLGSLVYEVVLKVTESFIKDIAYVMPIDVAYKVEQIQVTVFQIFTILIVHLLIKKKIIPPKFEVDNIKPLRQSLMIAATLVGIAFVYQINEHFLDMGMIYASFSTSFLLFALFMALILILLLISSVKQTIKQQVLDGNNILLQKHIYSQLDHYNQLEKSLVETRKIKHDMLNHMICLNHLLDESDIEQAKYYIKGIENRIRTIATTIETGNNIFDAILNEKQQIAIDHDIQLTFEGALENRHFIDIVDICTITSNSLDNALEAVMRLDTKENRKISIRTYINKGYWFYTITNDSEIVQIDSKQKITTTKSDPSVHGFGLTNIKEAVNKYGGDLNLSYQDNQFTLEVIIKCPN